MYALWRNRRVVAPGRLVFVALDYVATPTCSRRTPGLDAREAGRQADPQADENARLVRETERLTHRPTPAIGRGHGQAQLARAEFIIEVPKKVSQLFGLPEIPPDALK